MTNAPGNIGGEVRLGRSTLTVIGRHLGAMYEDVVADDMPQSLRTALRRLRAHDEGAQRREGQKEHRD